MKRIAVRPPAQAQPANISRSAIVNVPVWRDRNVGCQLTAARRYDVGSLSINLRCASATIRPSTSPRYSPPLRTSGSFRKEYQSGFDRPTVGTESALVDEKRRRSHEARQFLAARNIERPCKLQIP